IRNWLTLQGFPEDECIVADSGNGAHLLYRIDMSNNEQTKTMLETILKNVATKFSKGNIKIDPVVFNAARGWKVYGTQCFKGDLAPDNPHRYARILEVGKSLKWT